jgi:hypothetical protein
MPLGRVASGISIPQLKWLPSLAALFDLLSARVMVDQQLCD